MTDYAENCIHLKACRRLSKIVKAKNGFVARGCNETCSAFTPDTGETYVTVNEAVKYARDGVQSIMDGYGAYDVYCACDLRGMTLTQLCEEAEE